MKDFDKYSEAKEAGDQLVKDLAKGSKSETKKRGCEKVAKAVGDACW